MAKRRVRKQRESEQELTPRQIVQFLDRYIVGQHAAKRAVAIAVRNRWRRLQLDEKARADVTPRNILLIGPTGVGKTEIARRLALLTRAPFVKVEATKFTEVGYVGRDVESIIRDLVEVSFAMVRDEHRAMVEEQARERAEDRVIQELLNEGREDAFNVRVPEPKVREKMRRMLRQGLFDDREISVHVPKRSARESIPIAMGEQIEIDLTSLMNLVNRMMPPRRIRVPEAVRLLMEDELDNLLDHEKIREEAVQRAEEMGIVFLDELDKICARDPRYGPDVSREGVQRDLLPLVEGTTVNTRHGRIRTDYILFIGAGAFHISKPSDLMPELQGRFPIRVELSPLTRDDFVRILKEPENSLVRQYQLLMQTEGVELEFEDEALEAIAEIAYRLNRQTQDIGARRLQTVIERVMEDLSFEAPERTGDKVVITRDYVRQRLKEVMEDEDVAKYIL